MFVALKKISPLPLLLVPASVSSLQYTIVQRNLSFGMHQVMGWVGVCEQALCILNIINYIVNTLIYDMDI